MPVIIGSPAPHEPPPIEHPPPRPRPPEPVGPSISWTAVDGTVWPLTGVGFRALAGWTGLDSPEFQHYLDESPALDGSFYRGSRALMRTIVGPILVEGPDRATALARRRGLIAATNPQLGLGTLTVSEPDGSSRSIQAIRASGMEGDTSEDADGITWAKYPAIFFCPDPYFAGSDQVFTVRPPSSISFYPFYPLRLGTSRTFGDLTMPNAGDAPAWPVWRIDGPATAITLTNDTTGLTLELVITLSAGQWVEIDTRPGHKTIRDQAGTNRMATIQDGSALWPLLHGDNAVTVSVTASDDPSLVTATYAARYLSA